MALSDKRLSELTERLVKLCERPEYAGKTWTWDSIGIALGITATQAHGVIRYMRSNFSGWVWTVGTKSGDFVTMPTTSVIEALPGLVNQLRHTVTRDTTQARQWTILSSVDPDPLHSKIAGRMSRFFTHRADEAADRLETLHDLLPSEEEAVAVRTA